MLNPLGAQSAPNQTKEANMPKTKTNVKFVSREQVSQAEEELVTFLEKRDFSSERVRQLGEVACALLWAGHEEYQAPNNV